MSNLKRLGLIFVSWVLVVSLILLSNGGLVLAEEDDFEELNTLRYSIEGTYEGKPAEFAHRLINIGTEEELFRMDVNIYETERTMGVILDKENETAFIKQMGADGWQEMPMLFPRMWSKYREGAIGTYGSADDWRSWAEADQDEYILEGEENGEGYTTRIYGIEVDEPIEESVFSPDGS